ncbi:hypothetical protein F4811DRAFT_571648 [Daldinia bambusicola]|nr:hypothetical protein F4811DRAFT_571648 [Daldinia bambusicola]
MAEQSQTNHGDPPEELCVVCLEGDHDLRCFQCGCFWCRDCLVTYVKSELATRITWPPKCCKTILTEEDISWIQSSDLFERYREVNREMEGPPPLYCSELRCSAILNTENTISGSSVVVCDKCNSKTCQKCKRGHEPTESGCVEPSIDTALTDIARSERWQTCPRCNRMVDRTSGCNHMKCHCGHEFCYECGTTWRTCSCGVYQEDVVYTIQPRDGSPPIWISQVQMLQYATQQAHRRRQARLEQRQQHAVDMQRDQERTQQNQKENQRPEQRHDHGPSASSSGQVQSLHQARTPQLLIENPLRQLPNNPAPPPSVEPALSPLRPQTAIEQRRNYLAFRLLSETPQTSGFPRQASRDSSGFLIMHLSQHQQNPVPDLSQPGGSPAQQPPEEITSTATVWPRTVIPLAGRIRMSSTGSTRNPFHLSDPSPTSRIVQAKPRRRWESEP